MMVLAEAIRASETGTASATARDGTEVVVRRAIGKEEPDSQESYVVRVTRAGAPGEQVETPDLLEAIRRMQALHLDGFDPEFGGWRPGVGQQPSVDATPRVRAQ
jgi:hypothetical protein